MPPHDPSGKQATKILLRQRGAGDKTGFSDTISWITWSEVSERAAPSAPDIAGDACSIAATASRGSPCFDGTAQAAQVICF